MEYISSARGGKLLLYHGYLYRISKKTDQAAYYKCSKGCKATVVVRDGVALNQGRHVDSHYPDSVGRVKAIEAMRRSVRPGLYTPIPKLYKETMSSLELTEATAGTAPTYASVRSIMYRKRLKDYPTLPKSLGAIELPPELKQTLSGENFLLCDDGQNEQRMLIFSTVDNLRKLCQSKKVFADGTFKIAPSLFLQLYTIHAIFVGELIPVVYALLPNKQTETYVTMLRNIKTACTSHGLIFSPTVFQTDFEQSVFSAVKTVLPHTSRSGCLFHFSQAIWRRVQALGLVCQFKEDEEFNGCIKRLFGLGLVPPEHVEDLFQEVVENAPQDPQVSQLLDYVLENFIGDPGMGTKARFDLEIWNHFESVETSTNNKLEGWHFSMNQRYAEKHPHIFRFIIGLRREQEYQEKRILMLSSGQTTIRANKKWDVLAKRRQTLKTQYLNGQRTALQYLDAIKHVFHYE